MSHDDSAMPVERLSTISTELLETYVTLMRASERFLQLHTSGTDIRHDEMRDALAEVQKAQSI